MDIKQIIDKIPKEADVRPSEYQVVDRLDDVNIEYLKLITVAGHIGSKFPISDGSDNFETFTLVDGDNTFTRTIPDTSIQRVEYRKDENHEWECYDHDTDRCRDCYSSKWGTFTANQKKVFFEDAFAGEVKVTYETAAVTLFTQTDYDAVTPPSPDWLPTVFHPLLWMKPALDQARKYKPKRVKELKEDRNELIGLFRQHYARDAEEELGAITEEEENYR